MNLLPPPHFAAEEPHLDAMRMRGAFGEDVADDAVGETAGVLVLFQDDGDAQAIADVFSLFRVRHSVFSLQSFLRGRATQLASLTLPVTY